MNVAIKIENVSKLYRLGTVGTGTISHDLNRWWHEIRGKEDPYAKVGQVNDRTKVATSNEQREGSNDSSSSPSPLASSNSLLRASAPDYVWALRDINLEVQQGEILGIIGRNGAGKSTLLKLLSRVTAPTTGYIKTKGRIASLLEVGTGFHPEMTGRENIYMNGAILGMRRHEITRQLDEIVEFSGCAKYLETPVKRYSSGMTVRLGFAVAAHLECEILIIDEVLAVGDADFQMKCLQKMESISGSGRTVLFVSHQLAAIQAICSKTAIVGQGQICFWGPTLAALEAYATMASEWRASHVRSEGNGKGSQHATLSKLEIRNEKGEVTRTLTSGKAASLEFRISINERCSESRVMDIGFGIHSLTTDACITVDWSTFWERRYTVLADAASINAICSIRNLSLQPGNYILKTCIKLNGIVTDYLPDGVADFRVGFGDFYPKPCTGYSGDAPLLLAVDWK